MERRMTKESSLLDNIKRNVEEDLKELMSPRKRGAEGEEVGIYRLLFASNPKPYPISGTQHFLGTAFIALRLADYLGLSDKQKVTAFLAGLFHDYEKMGLDIKEMIREGIERLLGSGTLLFNGLNELLGNKLEQVWREAIELSLKLEGGGAGGIHLQKLAPLIRVADYMTGSTSSWDIMNIIELLVNDVGIPPKNVVPVIIGKQRPLVSMISESIKNHLTKEGLVPLVTTSTGTVFLTKDLTGITEALRKTYLDIARELIAQSVAKKEVKTRRVVRPLPIKGLVNFMERLKKRERVNIGFLISRVKTLRQIDESVIDATIEAAKTPVDKRYTILYFALIYAKTLSEKEKRKAPELLPRVLKELGIDAGKAGFEDALLTAYEKLSSMKPDSLSELLNKLGEKLKEYIKSIVSSAVDIKSLIDNLHETVSIGGMAPIEKHKVVKGEITCSICRGSVPKELAVPLKQYIKSLMRVFRKLRYAEVFHVDVQAAPDKGGSLEGITSRLYVCPICNYESIVFPEQVGFIDGMWGSVIVYYPAVSTDFIDVIRNVLREPGIVGYEKPLVIPDYISSKIIVKTSDERGRLRKEDILHALDIWYYCGGNLVLTTNALSSAFIWNGLPIEIEKTDTIIEKSVGAYMFELRLAKKREEWRRTRNLRRILYRQLQSYIKGTEALVDRKTDEVKFRRIGLIESLYPSLDIYSFTLRK